MNIKQQQELDAWIAENETCLSYPGHPEYVKGYNEGTKTAAEAIRQGNWTWEEYQEWKQKQATK